MTFDENHSYTSQNRVFSVLLGGAVPKELIGTTDSTFYSIPPCSNLPLNAPHP